VERESLSVVIEKSGYASVRKQDDELTAEPGRLPVVVELVPGGEIAGALPDIPRFGLGGSWDGFEVLTRAEGTGRFVVAGRSDREGRFRIAGLDGMIGKQYRKLDPERTLEEIPGVGPTIAPAVAALTGDVRRFRSVGAYLSFCGLCPRKSESGKRKTLGLAITKGGPRLLKRYIFLAAEIARRNDVEFAAKYQQLIARGKHHFMAVVALANMLARRAYALLKRRANGPAHYERRDTTGQAISRQQARAQVQRDYPTKREQERRKKEAPTTPPEAGPERAQKREGSTAAVRHKA
jgi:hypothetical protein